MENVERMERYFGELLDTPVAEAEQVSLKNENLKKSDIALAASENMQRVFSGKQPVEA